MVSEIAQIMAEQAGWDVPSEDLQQGLENLEKLLAAISTLREATVVDLLAIVRGDLDDLWKIP